MQSDRGSPQPEQNEIDSTQPVQTEPQSFVDSETVSLLPIQTTVTLWKGHLKISPYLHSFNHTIGFTQGLRSQLVLDVLHALHSPLTFGYAL